MTVTEPQQNPTLTSSHQLAAGARRKPLPPFSIRFSEHERELLESQAGGMALGAYIRAKVLDRPTKARRTGINASDRKALAKALALLGAARYASNLNQLAHLGRLGTLPLTPEMIAELREACAHIADIRALLMTALGSKSGAEE